jgi:NADH:ubiquinone oxidoreductase subunit F (NADH-binding)
MPRLIAAVQGRGATAEDPSPEIETRRSLRNCGAIDPESLDEALAAGAYSGFEKALAMKPEEVVELVRASGLRGRGGAYFPTAIKWDSAREHPGPRYLVVNAEEGEPGVFKDRHLMEGDPHTLVEGVLIAAYAVGAEKAYIYINGQAQLSAWQVELAIKDAREAGLIGEDILGSGFSCEVEIYRGAGGYVCGEESVILNSIEGERAVPRFRPPLPTEHGLFGRPTVINNVETLVNLPLILTEGVEWFRSVGTQDFPGTKLISLSGAVQRPGLYEVPMGTTIQSIIEECGGGAQEGHTITYAVVGGPSGGLMPASMLDVPIQGGMLHPSGPVLGAGGIVVLDERTPLSFVLRELTAYNKDESCGKCTPCREGTDRALALLNKAGDAPLSPEDRAELLELCDVMQTASLCGLGQMAPGPIRSALTLFETS